MTLFEVTDITTPIAKISEVGFKALFGVAYPTATEEVIQKNWNEFFKLDTQSRIYWLRGNKPFCRVFETYAIGWNDRPNCKC